ncbi:MAG: tol-pal system protein YbgF [Pseudomonadota bacterium]
MRPTLIVTPFLVAALTSLMLCAAPAHAGKKQDIELLQQQVAELQAALATLSQNSGRANADMTVKLSQMQAENQRLTGEIEGLRNQVRQLTSRMDTLSRVVAGENFSGLDTGLGPAQATTPPEALSGTAGDGGSDATADDSAATDKPGSRSVDPGTVILPADPAAAYKYASDFLLTGDYTRARIAFELFVEAHPSAPQTPDARFRLGEIYLATGANSEAAQAFINHIKLYPNNPRAPEAYLKLGTAFSRMEETTQACNIFKQVRRKFPNASPIILQRTDVEMRRINCR